MKKIAILTFSHAVNRGAHMQCYALSRVLLNWGYDVQIIRIELPKWPTSWKGEINMLIQNHLNKKFRKRYYPAITQAYHSVEELHANCPTADVFIVGSDQVWNSAITNQFGLEAFFLSFVPADKKKLAYAASFGTSEWMETDKDDQVKELLQNFHAISVRELDGIDLCKRVFGLNHAVAVIDPVFLLQDYSSVMGNAIKTTNDAICYPLYTNEETKWVFQNVCADLHLSPISYSRNFRDKGVKVKLFSSISNWLKSINQSQMVITNSFHCMAFCILFRKRFIVTPPFRGRESRILSILTQLGLESRYVRSISDFEERKEKLYDTINYAEVDRKLNILRSQSLDFLKKNI